MDLYPFCNPQKLGIGFYKELVCILKFLSHYEMKENKENGCEEEDTEKELHRLIERSQNENAALAKILKVLNDEQYQKYLLTAKKAEEEIDKNLN